MNKGREGKISFVDAKTKERGRFFSACAEDLLSGKAEGPLLEWTWGGRKKGVHLPGIVSASKAPSRKKT